MNFTNILKTIGKALLIIIVPIGVLAFIQYVCTIPVGSYICKLLPFVKALNKNYPHPENWVSWLISIYTATVSTFLTIIFKKYEKKKKHEEEKRAKEKNIVEWAKYLSFSSCTLPELSLDSPDDLHDLIAQKTSENYLCFKLNSSSKIPINFDIDISKIEIELSRVISGSKENVKQYSLERNINENENELENRNLVKIDFSNVSNLKDSPECLYEISSNNDKSELNFYFRYNEEKVTSNQMALTALNSVDSSIKPINHFIITITCRLYDTLLSNNFDAQFYNLILVGKVVKKDDEQKKHSNSIFEIYNITSSKQDLKDENKGTSVKATRKKQKQNRGE